MASKKPPKTKPAKNYRHPESESPMRPEVGTQAQFKKKLPPKKYRYDDSLSPALEWDGQNPAREQGEALIRQALEAKTLEEPKAAASKLKAISKSFLNWAGKAERLSFDVPTLPLFIHERLSTKAILETLKGHRFDRNQATMFDLWGDPQHSVTDQVLRAYEHKDKWVNRMILGDSVVVMNSLLHYEGLGGQVQMIYLDPPYGIDFGSNFQPFVRKNIVRHNDDDEMTREPEMVQAYRDTWKFGIHSYLSYTNQPTQNVAEAVKAAYIILKQKRVQETILGPLLSRMKLESRALSNGSPIDSTGKVKMNTKSTLSCIALLATLMISPRTVAARSQPQASPAAGTIITEVKVGRTGDQTVVRVGGSGRFVFRTVHLSDPERLVLDFDRARFSLARTSVPSTLRPVRGVRVGQFKSNVARVVIDLDSTVPYSTKSEGQSITVMFMADNAAPARSSAISPAPLEPPRVAAHATSTGTAPSVPLSQAAPNVSGAPSSPAASPQVAETFHNSIENGMLTFGAKNQPLRSILEQIGENANVVIDVAEGLGNEKISVDFRHYRLDEALRQMLKQYSALFLYGADKDSTGAVSLETVWVYPAKRGPGMDRFSMGMFRANTKHIEQTLADSDPEVRVHAVDSLIRRQGRQSVGVVLDAVRDPSEKVRAQALYRALSMGVEISEDTLIGLALNDESSNVRFLALQALPVDPTLRWVAERASNDSSQQIREAAKGILREFDSANTAPGMAANQPGGTSIRAKALSSTDVSSAVP